jgi:hypothetical protein
MSFLVVFSTLLAAQNGESDLGILIDETHRAETFLHASPQAGSITGVLEHQFLPINDALEESGGFSAPDPEKLSIHGGSTLWTKWHVDRFDITDAFFSGAAALHVPFRFLEAVSLRYTESPLSIEREGVVLHTGGGPGKLVSYSETLPNMGGIFPPGIGITSVFSNTHATEREPPPPDARRRFLEHRVLSLVGEEDAGAGSVRYAIEVDEGARRFLAFRPDGALDHPFRETYAIASGALQYRPSSDAYEVLALGEYRRRDHLFAELSYAPAETAKYESGALFAGIAGEAASMGVLLKTFTLRHDDLSFTRELLDPDGMGLEPYQPDGRFVTASLDAKASFGLLYLAADDKLLFFHPDVRSFSNPLTLQGMPAGRIDWSSTPTTEAFGEHRIGARDRVELGPLRVDWDVYLCASHALSSSGRNALFLPDVGAKTDISWRIGEDSRLFLALAKTPLPITPGTARFVDPLYLSAAGSELSVSSRLVPPEVDSGAIGLRTELAGWRLEAQGVVRLFRNTLWVDFADGAAANGHFENGVFFLGAGPHKYTLTNYPAEMRKPYYGGVQIQLYRALRERYLFDVGFDAFTSVGAAPFGNGPTTNDIGVLSYSTANPNGRINYFGSVDADRAFMVKALFGYRFADDLWLFASVRHKDGRPFSFYDVAESKSGEFAIYDATYRGSPHFGRPLLGPRTDFRVDVDLKLAYAVALDDMRIGAYATLTNAFDFGNELSELSTPVGKQTRAALELQIPRALAVAAEVRF